MRRREFWLILILQLQGAIRAKMSTFIVSKIQPIRLKDLGHVTRIDQSETSILRCRRFLRWTGEAQNIRPLIGQFWPRGPNKKNNKSICFHFKNISLFSFSLILSLLATPLLSLPWHSLCPLWWSSVHLSSYYHLPFVVLIPFIALVMVISLPIFSVFLSTLTFCSLDHIQCTGLCRHLRVTSFVYLHTDTYLSFLSPQVMSYYFSHANQGRLADYHLC